MKVVTLTKILETASLVVVLETLFFFKFEYWKLLITYINFYLAEVIPTADVAVAFKDVEAAFLVGAMPRREGMERKDLLSANVKIFKVQVRWICF
jgi:hypothetical protein